MACPPDNKGCVAKGKVSRIYARDENDFINLADLRPEETPGPDGNFSLRSEEHPAGGHPNYNALFSLLLAAAVNRYDLLIKTVDVMNDKDNAVVDYMVVEWE